MDRFTRNALCTALCAVIFWSFLGYLGSFYGDMGGTDAKVQKIAAGPSSIAPSALVSLSPLGENIGFTLAGILAGLIVGYYYPDFFERPTGRETSA